MIGLNNLCKLFLVVALGFFATATSTDVAQDQPTQEALVSKEDEVATEPQEVPIPTKAETKKQTETSKRNMKFVEWLLLSEPENRKQLRERLPRDLAAMVPEEYDEPIKPFIEKKIRTFFSFSVQKQGSMILDSYGRNF
ncbi:SmORF protein [Babesia bovis T2Bo]|uniref:SmORF n=1 Tax=Babesia bovis TaxID=5865 RepID=A7AWP0_BABBO|nr:SmORF protein [Babesia bovis T2Bo]EDO05468.1 SmORF protein [Babesia bovis T2Bo]|eukprot:XP_001609036.1 SmORF [Babesia bovis T2Bo]